MNMTGCLNRHISISLKMIFRFKGTIEVSPKSSLVNERVRIRGNGYPPSSPITVKAKGHCAEEKLSFTSFAHITTNENGTFDLLSSESTEGTYTGIDGMGLFWSMEPYVGHMNRFQMNNALIPVKYNFSVMKDHIKDIRSYAGEVVCESSIERSFLAEGVKRKVISEVPLHGTLFIPPGSGPFPAIITIYGGLKKKQVVEDAAAMLANSGFLTLAMAFFAHQGLPDVYYTEPIRLELFKEAIDYLKALHVVKSDAIGVYGISKGGEISFLMASFFEDVKAAVAVNSMYYAVGSEYSLGGKIVLPDGGYKVSRLNIEGNEVRDIFFDYQECPPASVLPIENSAAKLLFIAGSDDRCTYAEKSADLLVEKLKRFGKTNPEVCKYPGMGHLVDCPFAPPSTMSPIIFFPNELFYLGGGDKRSHATQVVKVWSRVISFFKKSLR